MKSALRQPLLFAALLIVSLTGLTVLATLADLTMAAQRDIPRTGWWTGLRLMILPASLLALVLVQLPAGLARRGGPLLLTALALLVCWSGRRFVDRLSDDDEADRSINAPVFVVEDRFIPLDEPEHYLLADRVTGQKAIGVVILDTSLGSQWRLRHLAEVTIDSDKGTVGEFAVRDMTVYRGLTASGQALTSLQRDLEGLIGDIENAEDPRGELLLLLAPITALAGLGFLVRCSRWPLIGAALALACSRGVFVIYRVAKHDMYAPVAERLGDWSNMFPSLVLLTLGSLLILADALTETVDE